MQPAAPKTEPAHHAKFSQGVAASILGLDAGRVMQLRESVYARPASHGLPMVIRRAVAWFSRTRFFRRFGPVIMPPLERATNFISRGRLQLSGVLVPSLILHTTGAKTGIERDTPLMYCPDRAGRLLVTGSNFAREMHPSWTANLLADPEASVSLRGRRIPVHAELVGDDEREAVWRTIERQWPGYRGYERASGRTLRIFRLTPQDTRRG